jgi:hypothetical protein
MSILHQMIPIEDFDTLLWGPDTVKDVPDPIMTVSETGQ